jgi:hypothetical protein
VETPLRSPPPKAEADAAVAVGVEVGVDGAVLVAQRSTQILGVRGIRERKAAAVPIQPDAGVLVPPGLLKPRGAAIP